VVIVAIDDQTVREVGSYPLPRLTMAALVSAIGRTKPKVVALDVLFVEPGSTEGDLALASALRATPSVLAAAGLFGRDPRSTTATRNADSLSLPEAQDLLLPRETFSEAAALGVVNIATDASGVPRHIPLLLRSGDRIWSSFPLRTASIALKSDPVLRPNGIALGSMTSSTAEGYALPLRFYGPGGTIRTIGANHVLNGKVGAEAMRDKIVVVGATVAGGGDTFPTPFDPVLPGVEVLATAISHLVEGDALVRDNRVRFVDAAMAFTLPMLFILLLSWHRSVLGFALIALISGLWIGLTALAFAHGIWLTATLPLLAAVPPAILFGAARLWLDRSRADRLSAQSKTLRSFQPPSLAERLMKDPGFLATPVRQKAAVVFIDLSGFTGLSEILPLDDTREMLRGFHALVDREAVNHQGIVASFMGDGAMILFGLPDPSPDDACHAVKACVALSAHMDSWAAELPDAIVSRIGFKIGAHCGMIIASRLGGDSHQHITAIGDTVNIASRLMEVAASHHADVALSDDLYRVAGDACSAFDAGVLDGTFPTSIRGRSGTIPVWLWRRNEPPSAVARKLR
jgi:adenylate cyclase